MNRVLLPTDFSDCSWSAIVYATSLYAGTETEFYLLHSTDIRAGSMSILSSKLNDTMYEQALRQLTEYKEQLLDIIDQDKQKVDLLIRKEELTDAIEYCVPRYKIDMVVMATQGTTKAKQLFFGGNTVHTLKALKSCPLLIVPSEYSFNEPKQIAFPTDYNRFYCNAELKPVRELASLYNSTIRVLHIQEEKALDTVQRYNLRSLKDYFRENKVQLHWMPDYDKKSEEINDFIEELGIDILVMLRYKHSLIEAIFNEPVIKKISFKPTIPFMVIPEFSD